MSGLVRPLNLTFHLLEERCRPLTPYSRKLFDFIPFYFTLILKVQSRHVSQFLSLEPISNPYVPEGPLSIRTGPAMK
jgi:hypothetical protein